MADTAIEKYAPWAKALDWQDIETAPKNKTNVMLATKWGPMIGFWHQPGNPKYDGFWTHDRHTTKCPKKWMPLPDPNKPNPYHQALEIALGALGEMAHSEVMHIAEAAQQRLAEISKLGSVQQQGGQG